MHATHIQAYPVSRRHHIAVGRQDRVITLDGDWIHIVYVCMHLC